MIGLCLDAIIQAEGGLNRHTPESSRVARGSRLAVARRSRNRGAPGWSHLAESGGYPRSLRSGRASADSATALALSIRKEFGFSAFLSLKSWWIERANLGRAWLGGRYPRE